MRKSTVIGKRVVGLMSVSLVLSVAGFTGEKAHLRWMIQSGQEVDKSQAERLYRDACRWIETRFGAERGAIRPTITVHVGESCPNPAISGACLSPVLGALYLPEWDETSPAAVIQATFATALLQLMDRQEVQRVVRVLLAEDARDFMDARQLARKTKE
jgi:hypothetical protein